MIRLERLFLNGIWMYMKSHRLLAGFIIERQRLNVMKKTKPVFFEIKCWTTDRNYCLITVI